MSKRITSLVFFLLIGFNAELPSQEEKAEQRVECPLSRMAANGVDWLLCSGQDSQVKKPIADLGARAVSTVVFPVCTAADMLYHVGHGNSQGVKKCALGLITSPTAIVSPDLVTQHFVVRKTPTYRLVPYGKLYSTDAYILSPSSAKEVSEIILAAKEEGVSISILGAGMSQGKQTLPCQQWNWVIHTKHLNKIVIHPEAKYARVGAGATWEELQNAVNQCGLAVQVMQASNIFTIGGSLSVNCHGWDHRAGSVRNTVRSVTIVNADGCEQVLTPGDELFNYVIGGYGCFGVIVEAEINLTDNVLLVEDGLEIAPCNYLHYFKTQVQTDNQIDMHLYRLSLEPRKLFKTGVAVNYYRAGNQGIKANLVDEPSGGSRMDRIKLHALRRLGWLRNYAWHTEKKEALTPKEATRNEFMRPPIKPIFNDSSIDTEWLQEFFVRGEDLDAFLKFLASVLERNQVAVFNASVRFVKQDKDTVLSYAKQGDRFAIVLFFNQKLTTSEIDKTAQWVQQVIDYVVAKEGAYYLPYQHFASGKQFEACYPGCHKAYGMKQAIDPSGVFKNGLYHDYLTALSDPDPSLFREIFAQYGQRRQVRDFLENIFMQLDERAFFKEMDLILKNPTLSDADVYLALYQNISKAKWNAVSSFRLILKSLNALKTDLADQTAQLVANKSIKGYVEIGYPGRLIRPLKQRLALNSPLYVVHEKESLSDYIEAGFPRPYDTFISINDYVPISEKAIPSNSVDLVCCYIGLHHIPADKIVPFVQSIKRILRPGGAFILMEHDAHSSELVKLADIVHSIFNAATGVSPQENAAEIRNFQSLAYWIALLQEQGFDYSPTEAHVRDGDPTLNSLVRFDKPFDEPQIEDKHTRPLAQTYLTAPEWQNVQAAQRYASFAEEHPNGYYPYFSEIGAFWNVYGASWQAARQKASFSDVALSEYNLMNLFVGTAMTVEYAAKGVAAAPLACLPETHTLPEQERTRALKAYSEYIAHTPFYQYSYFRDIGNYWKAFGKSLGQDRTVLGHCKDLVVGIGVTLENSVKGVISAPIAWMYTSEERKEADTIRMLVRDAENRVQQLGTLVTVVRIDQDTKELEVPRYMPFKETILALAHYEDVEILNIAGNALIQMDVRLVGNDLIDTHAKPLYRIPDPLNTTQTTVAFEVPINQLLPAIRAFKKQGAEVVYIHDY